MNLFHKHKIFAELFNSVKQLGFTWLPTQDGCNEAGHTLSLKNTLKEGKSDENTKNSIILNTFILPSSSSSGLKLQRELVLIQTQFEQRDHVEAKFVRLCLLLLSLAPLKLLTARANTLRCRSFQIFPVVSVCNNSPLSQTQSWS